MTKRACIVGSGPSVGACLALALCLAVAAPAVAFDIEVPVTYRLADGREVEAVLVDGAGVTADGIEVTVANGTAPTLLNFEKIDVLERFAVVDGKELALEAKLNDGRVVKGRAPIAAGRPLFAFAPVDADGVATGPVRRIGIAELPGLTAVSVEAELTPEIDVAKIKEINKRFLAALDAGDYEAAVDRHNEIADELGAEDDEDEGEGGAAGSDAEGDEDGEDEGSDDGDDAPGSAGGR